MLLRADHSWKSCMTAWVEHLKRGIPKAAEIPMMDASVPSYMGLCSSQRREEGKFPKQYWNMVGGRCSSSH